MDQLDDCIIPAEVMRAWGWKERTSKNKSKRLVMEETHRFGDGLCTDD